MERVAESSIIQRVEVTAAAAGLAQAIVVRPGLLLVFAHLLIELKSTHLSQSIVNVVEGIDEDMRLLHPESATLQEITSGVASPGHVFALQIAPDLTASGSVWPLGEYAVLELVYAAHVGKHLKRGSQVIIAVQIGFLSEEALHPRISEKLHRHGMYFTQLAGGECLGSQRIDTAGKIAFEGMSGLMGQNIHIRAGAIEVREDKGCTGLGQERAVATGLFAGLAVQIEELVLNIKSKKTPDSAESS